MSRSSDVVRRPADSLGSTPILAVSRAFQDALDDGFSGVALVRSRGETVLHEAAGCANRELATPNTVDTVFDIGSITKQYTAALVMALQEAGRLGVGDRLTDHFGDVPDDKADITIHQLLTHTAGLGDGFGADDVPIGLDVYLALTWATPLRFEPGTMHRYSNAGYSIAAAIAEAVSGQSYEAALRSYVLGPAGLDATGYLLPDWSERTLAIGYGEWGRREDRRFWEEDGPYWNLRGNGGLLSTAEDLLKWHDALSAKSVLRADSIDAMQGRQVDETSGRGNAGVRFYGYGWVTEDMPPVGVVHWHDGGNGSFHAFVGRAADEDTVVITLANESSDVSHQLAGSLGRALGSNR